MEQEEGVGEFNLGRAVAKEWLRVRAGAAALMAGGATAFWWLQGEKSGGEGTRELRWDFREVVVLRI